MIYDRPIRMLMVEFARTDPGEFDFDVVRTWFARHYPKVAESAIRTHLHAMTDSGLANDGRMWPIFDRVRHGIYRVRPDVEQRVKVRRDARPRSATTIWSLLRQCTSEIGPRFTRREVLHWFAERSPDTPAPSITAHMHEAVIDPTAPPKRGSRQPYLRRVRHGLYEVAVDDAREEQHAAAATHAPTSFVARMRTALPVITPVAPVAAAAYRALAETLDPVGATAQHIAAGTSAACHDLRMAGRLDLTVEALVAALRPSGMPPEVITTAQDRLRYYGAAGLA